MGLFSLFKSQDTTLSPEDAEKVEAVKKLRSYITEIEGKLRTDWSTRVYGDGTYSGYQTLRDFYKGKQWSYRKDGGGTMRTYNYVFTVVENMTAFLTNEPPQISCPPTNQSDVVERVIAEGRTKLLDAVHEINSIGLVFQRAVRTGSITGDSFLFGPIPTFTTDEAGNRTFESIRYWNIERPESVRVIWKDDNFSEIGGFILHYRVSLAQAKRMFKKQIEEQGLILTEDEDVDNPIVSNSSTTTKVPMVTVKEYWDDDEYMLMFGNSNIPAEYVKHDWGWIPLEYVPNIHLPGEPKGTSDIEHELDPQQEYNERASDFADIIKTTAAPSYIGHNIDNVTEVRTGNGTIIYNLPDDATIEPMPNAGNAYPMEGYLNDRKNDMIALSGLNQVLYPGSQVLQATGRALSVVMQGVNNKVSLRKEWWTKAFQSLNAHILFLAERYMGDQAGLLINGQYKSDVFISSVLLRSVSDEINKFQSKVQSLTTTQHNVGIDNPSEEQKLMKEELSDPILATEIAKQPALLQQVIQQQMAAAQQGISVGGGGPGVGGAPASINSEDDNTPGENPQSGQGVASPVSPQGAIAQRGARAGNPTQLSR